MRLLNVRDTALFQVLIINDFYFFVNLPLTGSHAFLALWTGKCNPEDLSCPHWWRRWSLTIYLVIRLYVQYVTDMFKDKRWKKQRVSRCSASLFQWSPCLSLLEWGLKQSLHCSFVILGSWETFFLLSFCLVPLLHQIHTHTMQGQKYMWTNWDLTWWSELIPYHCQCVIKYDGREISL